MDSERLHHLHMLFFPLMAPGHMIPMLDIANLFAFRGVKATILTTPGNAPLVQTATKRAVANGHNLQLHILPFPSSKERVRSENAASLSIPEERMAFFQSLRLLRPPFEEALRSLHPVHAIVSDMFFPWTFDVAQEFGIPRLSFHGTSLFALCASGTIRLHKLLDRSGERIVFPGFPHRVELLRTQVVDIRQFPPQMAKLFEEQREADARSYGVVVNSFYELEPEYARYYREVMGRKHWQIGPVSLCNEDAQDISVRGSDNPIDQHHIIEWLDSKKPRSVIYICFGSMATVATDQLREIALYLESTEHPFIWVIKGSSSFDGLGTEELTGELEKCREGKGLVIRGWAPQVLILNHEAVGGFVTHCGWNSCLEGISAGVPIVTWPRFADQFFNEKLVVEILEVGVGMGVKEVVLWEEARAVVKAEDVRRAVDGVMGDSNEAEGMRRRAKELSFASKRAMEPEGSSYMQLGCLIDELIKVQK